MKAIVVFSSHRGNTGKVAAAIAQALNCKAVELTVDFDVASLRLADYDVVFLGTGVRGGEPYVELQSFLKSAPTLSAKRFVLFLTWAGGGVSNRLTYELVQKAVEARGQRLEPDYFICLGQTFSFTHRGRPNMGDLQKAAEWAKKQL